MIDFKSWFLKESYSDDYLAKLVPHDLIGSGSFAQVYSTQDSDIVMRVESDMPYKMTGYSPQSIDTFTKADQEYMKGNPGINLDSRNGIGQPCEKFMTRPEIQATGGVAKIYKIERRPYNFNDEKKPIVVTYKERVNPEWLGDWQKKYGFDNVNSIFRLFRLGERDKAVEKLKEFDNTEGLQKAIELGLPLDDLAHYNLGVNKEGQLVAIDC